MWLGCDASGNVIFVSWFWRCGRLSKRAWNNDLRCLIKLSFLKVHLVSDSHGCQSTLMYWSSYSGCKDRVLLPQFVSFGICWNVGAVCNYFQLEWVCPVNFVACVHMDVVFFGYLLEKPIRYLPVLSHLPGLWFYIVIVEFLLCNGRMSCAAWYLSRIRDEPVWFNTWVIVCGDSGGRLELVLFRPLGHVCWALAVVQNYSVLILSWNVSHFFFVSSQTSLSLMKFIEKNINI